MPSPHRGLRYRFTVVLVQPILPEATDIDLRNPEVELHSLNELVDCVFEGTDCPTTIYIIAIDINKSRN